MGLGLCRGTAAALFDAECLHWASLPTVRTMTARHCSMMHPEGPFVGPLRSGLTPNPNSYIGLLQVFVEGPELETRGDKIMVMVESLDKPDKQGTARPRQPVQNLSYSGHTAWVMAMMSELAYMRFEEEDLGSLLALPAELGKAMGRPPSNSELQKIEGLLAARDYKDWRLLRAVLTAGGFELVGSLSNAGTDTQGFVAVRQVGDARDMGVVSFRGTENEQDWKTNLRCSLTPVDSPQAEGGEPTGKVHQGFLDAFRSVRGQVDRYSPCAEGLPVFITGHSLGGALATLGAGHLSGWRPGGVLYLRSTPCRQQGVFQQLANSREPRGQSRGPGSSCTDPAAGIPSCG